jgi:hypothetical protein
VTAEFWTTVGIIAGGVATLAIFSFLIKENPFYRVFEHIFIGLGVGLGIVMTIRQYLWPKAVKPVIEALATMAGQPPHEGPVSSLYLVYIPFLAFGCLYYFIYSRKHGWLARLVIGFSLGAGGGLAIKAFCSITLPQVIASFKPIVVVGPGGVSWAASLSNIVFVGTLMCVMTYFFFSFEHDKPVIKQMSYAGRWLMMVCFGAFFGATIMARMSLLIERLDFLTAEWWPTIVGLFG